MHVGLGVAVDGRVHNTSRSKLSDDDMNAIAAVLRADPFLTANALPEALSFPVHEKTLRRNLKKRAKLYNFKAASKCNLTPLNALARVAFAERHLHWTADREWSRTIFMDEKTFTSGKDNRLKVWRPRGERFSRRFIKPSLQSGRVTLNTWGWISSAGPGN